MLFSSLNFAVLLAYLGGMLGIGAVLARKQKSTEDFFLAGRRMPWLIVAMSMYASLTSAVTYMGLPATAHDENISLIVVCIISPIVAPFLILLFYPFYTRLRVTTSYEYIGKRFGRPARYATSALFLLARLGWLGTVIYAPAMALSVVTGLPVRVTILLMGAIATVYTVLGGVSADIWSDVVQFVVMVGGAIWVAVTLVNGVPEGVSGILDAAGAAGRLQVLDWKMSLTEMSGVIVGVTFFFQLLQDYGTDQTTVQRLMATPSLKGVSKAIVFNAGVDAVMVGLLLFIGIGIFAFSRANPGFVAEGVSGDKLFPYYIIHALPDGVSGLLIAAILAAAMSSMDSGISSLATVVVHDFVRPLRRTRRSERQDLRLARGLTLMFGVFGTLVALYVIASFDRIIEAYTTIISLFNGPILALFLLGVLTRRGRFEGWVVGAVSAIVATRWLQVSVGVHWVYYLPFSFSVAYSVGYLVSCVMPRREIDESLVLGGGGARATEK